MELKDAIYARRSVRKYNNKPISDDDLQEIIEAALWAPSAVNLQHWYFVVCKSDEAIKKLTGIMEGTLPKLTEILENRFKNNPEVISETVNFVKNMGGAKVCVLTFLQSEEYDESTAAIQSAAAGMENMVLMAQSKGISSCWLTAPLHVEGDLRQAFAPNKGPLVATVVLGYSDTVPKAPRRKEGRYKII